MSSGMCGEGEGSSPAPCPSGFLVPNSGELCAGVLARVPTESALSAASGTCAIGLPPLTYTVSTSPENGKEAMQLH